MSAQVPTSIGAWILRILDDHPDGVLRGDLPRLIPCSYGGASDAAERLAHCGLVVAEPEIHPQNRNFTTRYRLPHESDEPPPPAAPQGADA